MRALAILAAALALAGCATCPMPAPAPATQALASEGYALSGRVVSALAEGKLGGTRAIALNAELQRAQADLRAGKTAQAHAIIDSVNSAVAVANAP
jgi:uncharacterized lipoprotein YajG